MAFVDDDKVKEVGFKELAEMLLVVVADKLLI